jgi:hypothetical protein
MAPVTTLTFASEPAYGDLAADLLGRYFRELDSRFPDGFDAARTLGAKTARLDTSAHLAEAIGLYRSAGYVEIPAYNDNEYAAHWLEKPLG